MIGRLTGWAWVAVLLAILGACAWTLGSGAPEHADWRHVWREAPLVFWPAQWAEFPLQPNLITFRGAHLGLVHWLGVGFERLWIVGAGLALLCAVALERLARRTLPGGGGPWVLVALVTLLLSPGFGANWLIAERFRVVLPAVWFLLAVRLLQRGTAARSRLLAAALCAGLALTTHDGGALAWAALLPLVATAAARGGRRPWAYVAAWTLAFNVLALFVWDEAYSPLGGLGVHLRERPLELLTFVVSAVGLVVPEPLPAWQHGQASVGAVALATLALLSVVVWRCRADTARVERASPWLACAWFGALAGLALAHRHYPLTLPEEYEREIFWTLAFLPIGLAGAAAALWPDLGARARGPALALVAVLGAQVWWAGVGSLAVKGRVLRQAEAALALAELDGLLAATPGPLPFRTDRDYLRGLGHLARATPLDGDALLALPRVAPVGSVQRVDGTVIGGEVATRADFTSDLVVLVHHRAAGGAHVVATVGPIALGPLGTEPFRVDLASLASFAPGDALSAVAFDNRRRLLGPLAGRLSFRDGGFVATEAGR